MTQNKKKILVIEDDEHIAKVYEMKFAKEGYDVTLAFSGERGIEKLATERPDLIILDIMLPNKDGFFVLEELKKNPDFSVIPVLAISNLGQQKDQERAIALGAKEYLVKVEYSMREIIDRAKKYLD